MPLPRRWRRFVALFLFALAGLIGIVLGARAVLQARHARATAITGAAGVDSLETVRLGGAPQAVLIRGHDRAKPVLLWLHGGPGVPMMPFAHLLAPLERDFVVVHWDQRGAGRSFVPNLPAEGMTVAQFTADALELTDLLRRRFGAEKIFLCGHSWGSLLGARLVAAHPDRFLAYAGVGQLARMHGAERVLHAWAVQAAADQRDAKAQEELRQIGPPPLDSFDKARRFSQVLNRLAEAVHPQQSDLDFLRLALVSPHYRLGDLFRFVRGADWSGRRLWREAYDADLFRDVPRLEVPVVFLQGRYDGVVTAEVAEEYFRALEAPRGKKLVWFETDHFPQIERPAEFCAALRDALLGPP